MFSPIVKESTASRVAHRTHREMFCLMLSAYWRGHISIIRGNQGGAPILISAHLPLSAEYFLLNNGTQKCVREMLTARFILRFEGGKFSFTLEKPRWLGDWLSLILLFERCNLSKMALLLFYRFNLYPFLLILSKTGCQFLRLTVPHYYPYVFFALYFLYSIPILPLIFLNIALNRWIDPLPR